MVLHLQTNEGKDDIISICSFILNPDCLKISEEAVEGPAAEVQLSEDELGYGFFEPLDAMFPPLEGEAAAAASVVTPVVPALPAVTSSGAEKKSFRQKRNCEKPGASQESTTIRVGIEKVDQLINLIGELVITQAMLEQRTQLLDPIENERLLSSVAHLTA